MRLRSFTAWIGLWTLFLGMRIGFAQAPPAPPKAGAGGCFTSFDGLKIYYEVQGQGPPVVLLHGFTGTLAGWRGTPLCTELLAQGHQLVALDLRGNGRSGKPTALAGYEHDAEAWDVMGLATVLGFAHYQVVGYSRGAIIAARVLVLDTRVTAAVLGGMGEAFTNPDWPRRLAFYRALSGQETAPEFDGFLQSVQARGLDRQALAWQQQAQPSTSPAALASIRVPVLVISGAADNDCGSAEALAQLLPAATARRVPGTHDTTMKSVPFAREVTSFLQQHNQQTATSK